MISSLVTWRKIGVQICRCGAASKMRWYIKVAVIRSDVQIAITPLLYPPR